MRELALAVAQSIAAPGDLDRSVRDHARLAAQAAAHGARLVLFPELSLTGYDHGLTMSDALTASDPRLAPLAAVADAHDLIVVAGAPLASARGLHIGALHLGPHGGAGSYAKEYLHGGEEVAFVPGPGGAALAIADQRIGLAICADLTHPEHAGRAAAAGATVYAASCFLTETGWDADAGLLAGHARAHRMLVLMANYGAPTARWSSAGKSAIWSDDGTLLACAPAAGEALIVARRSSAGWSADVVLPT